MLLNILKFEWQFFSKKKSFYLMLLFFAVMGFLTATSANFSFPDTAGNSPYVINFIYGLFSLLNIFSATVLAAQCLFREKDSRFESVLFATPLRKTPYIGGRFIIIFIITVLCNGLLMCGLIAGHELRGGNAALIPFGLWNYLQPFFLVMIPDILFCTAVATCIGLVSKNKLLVYVSGIFIYFLYWGINIYTQSPLMATSAPASASAMSLAAKLDPFGVAAFYDQTKYWSSVQRNSQLLSLSGNLLFNRVLYFFISIAFLLIAFRRFSFTVNEKRKIKPDVSQKPLRKWYLFFPVNTVPSGLMYHLQTLWSLVKIEIKNIFKSIPLWIICLGWMGFLSIELFSVINGNSRIPERFATSSLMMSTVLEELPLVAIFIILFYGNEIFWRSKSAGFLPLEDTTPVKPQIMLISKWISLGFIIFLLIGLSILLGVIFQFAYQFPNIDWNLYLELFYLTGLPLSLIAAFVIGMNAFIRNKYVALVIASVIVIVTNTSLIRITGSKNPLLFFANSFDGNYSDFNGFGIFLKAFGIKMIYWSCITAIIFFLAIKAWKDKTNRNPFSFFSAIKKPVNTAAIALFIAGAFLSGKIISTQTKIISADEINNHKEAFEKKYSYLKDSPQLTVTSVETYIDLFPQSSSYRVSGKYKLINRTGTAIDTVTVFGDTRMNWKEWKMQNGRLVKKDSVFGYYTFLLNQSLKPGDSIPMEFKFDYKASAFNKLISYNTIIESGAFIRISNFLPRPGYNHDEEIDDTKERRLRKMPSLNRFSALPERNKKNYDYGYIHLNTFISTSGDQTAIGVGELKKKWKQNKRNYFQYTSETLIPFRFAISSAPYAVKRVQYNNTNIEVYYHPEHYKNIAHLLSIAKATLDYCEKNIDSFPFKTLRFIEISSFTRGFAGTAYPTDLFINESFGFQNKITGDPNKDIMNEMVSHELNHSWWGNSKVSPEYGAGSILMTETLAMYTELMIYKNTYGEDYLLDRVNVHKDIYLGDRGFSDEEPLYLADPRKPYLFYDKGQVVMYELYKYLGEEKINKALKSFYDKYAFPNPPPVSTDLINEFYAVADKSLYPKIDELFEQIVTYDLKIISLAVNEEKAGKYILKINADAIKYEEDGKGGKKQIPFTEALSAAIFFKDGSNEIIKLYPQKSTVDTSLLFSRKPARVVLDPEGKLLTISDENKEKMLQYFSVSKERRSF